VKGHIEDRLRLIHPRSAELLEETDAIDNNLIINSGEGYIDRFQPSGWRTELTIRPDIETAEEAQAASIASRMGDGKMHLIHISGVNQIADGMTKMDTHIDYVGRIVHRRADFLEGKATPVRDLDGKVLYRSRKTPAPPKRKEDSAASEKQSDKSAPSAEPARESDLDKSTQQ
jgi:hypothetical protein